jgi:hypothetical protein
MFEIDLEWPVASGYELRAATELEGEIALYRAEGATITWRRPLEITPTIHAEFANLDGSEQSCLGFAHKYGLLNMAGYPPSTTASQISAPRYSRDGSGAAWTS